MSLLLKKSIGEIAAEKPDAARLFEILGIDYSCHGNLSLHEACTALGLDAHQVRKSIDQLPRGDDVNWLEQPVTGLLRRLRDEDHPALRRALANAATVLFGTCEICSEYPGKVGRIQVAFAALDDALRPHTGREDRVLYPVIEHLDRVWTIGDPPSMQLTGGLGPAIHSLMLDHGMLVMHLEDIDRIVEEIAELPRPCQELLDAMRNLDHLLREHVHLENNVLFPRALALEVALASEREPAGAHR